MIPLVEAHARELIKAGLESGAIKLLGPQNSDLAPTKARAEADALYLSTLLTRLVQPPKQA